MRSIASPCLETAEIKMLLNGPESFTPDGNFILGEAPELQLLCGCGFQFGGYRQFGAGRLIAEWIVGGEPPRRPVGRRHPTVWKLTGNRRALFDRTAETLGLHYAMRWPRQELENRAAAAHLAADRPAGRPERQFNSRNGFGNGQLLKPRSSHAAARRLGTPGWLPWMNRRSSAPREAVAIYDQAFSFSKPLLQGARCAGGAAAPVRQRGRRAGGPHGLHRDAQRAAAGERHHGGPPRGRAFPIITGSAQTTRDDRLLANGEGLCLAVPTGQTNATHTIIIIIISHTHTHTTHTHIIAHGAETPALLASGQSGTTRRRRSAP